MNESKIIKIGTLITKIFLVGLLIQFFVQTFVTYQLHGTGTLWNLVWMWKEIIILAIAGFLIWFLSKRNIREARRKTTPIKQFVLRFGITLLVMLFVSIVITQSGVGITVMSLRYSMMGFFIFIIFFAFAYLFFGTREINIVKRYTRIIKALLVGSLVRWGILWLIPNLLGHFGYNQFNYEGDIGIAPPAVYYTQYDSGFVRNQFLFERPISRGFFLVAFWPLFFLLCMKKKSRSDKAIRGGLYGLAMLSTFSRAAWIAWAIEIVILVLLQMNRKHWKVALYSFLPLLLLFAGVTYVGRDQIINRSFSNNGHLSMIVSAAQKVIQKPFFGRGAGFAGPASHYLPAGEAYNPENQYLQIWLEYGVFGFAGRMYLYLWLHLIGRNAYKLEQHTEKHKLLKKARLYGILIFGLSLGLFGLTIEGFVLHSFVDRMIVYPFMAVFGLTYALYLKSLTNKH
ncbi:MAG: O-antigen ligase family protein [candidate division SR1 bacterium]|nr:O-antigen ligase family protein [candidate division SR1 bacterium]